LEDQTSGEVTVFGVTCFSAGAIAGKHS